MDEERSVVLNADRKSLADFVISLLQQPRRIEKRYVNIGFYLDHRWILNVIELCEQRMHQNHHTICSFEIKVSFEDGHQEHLFDLPSFKNFYSNRQSRSVGFDLNLSYLVNFANVIEAEKQDIRVTAYGVDLRKSGEISQESHISYSISYSNTTWGEDMSRHIAGHIDAAVQRPLSVKVLRTIAGLKRSSISILVLPFAMALFIWYIQRQSHAGLPPEELVQRMQNEASADLTSISARLDLILKLEMEKRNLPFWPLIIFSILGGAVTVFPDACEYLSDHLSLSYVSLNQYTEDKHKKRVDVNTRLKWIVVGACVTVPLGAIVAYLRTAS